VLIAATLDQPDGHPDLDQARRGRLDTVVDDDVLEGAARPRPSKMPPPGPTAVLRSSRPRPGGADRRPGMVKRKQNRDNSNGNSWAD